MCAFVEECLRVVKLVSKTSSINAKMSNFKINNSQK